MMEWLDDVKRKFGEETGREPPSDRVVLETIISTTKELKPKIKNQIILLNVQEKKLVKKVRKCNISRGVIHWPDSTNDIVSCLFELHGHTWYVMKMLQALNGIHPTAPSAVWMAMKMLFEDTSKAEKENIFNGVDLDAVDDAILCDDAKELMRRYGKVTQRLREFEKEFYHCIDDVCQYMESFDTASIPPTERMICANDTVRSMISDIMILRRMSGGGLV